MSDPLEVPLEVLRSRSSEKWQRYPGDVLPLWVAEMDVQLAPAVAAAITHAIRAGDTGYASGHRYQEALAGFAAQQWNWELDPGKIATVPNVMLGVVGALELVLDRGAAVLTSVPVYPPLLEYPRAAGFQVTTVPLRAAERLDVAAITAAMAAVGEQVRPGTSGYRGAYLLCNPHNPTGVVPTMDELTALGNAAREHDFVVISDEIHAPLSYLPFTPATVAIPDSYAILAASKAWNLAGLNVAGVIAGDEAVLPARRVAPYLRSAVSHVAVMAHVAALQDGVEWLEQLRVALLHRRELLGTMLAKRLPMLGYREPDGTYLAWLDFGALGSVDPQWAQNPARKVLDDGRVALTAGGPFGSSSHARLNFATSQEILVAAIDRIALAVG